MTRSNSFRSIAKLLGIICLLLIGPAISRVSAQDAPPPPAPGDPNAAAAPDPGADPNVQVMNRGPLHEAYAAPVSDGQPTAGLVIPRQPPAPVNEIPPDMKPEGDKAVWIPGYWSWDDERKDFLWVSGVWRVPPPGFRWMPGYWQDNQGQGHQWISGYWMPAQLQETTFMPQPPQSIDNGPTSAQPDANHFWVGGHWQWYQNNYAWQPGYWAVSQPDWIWVPASYYWCPSGWVYVPGYWDYPLARRGLVFSPVYFAAPVAYYRPAVCLDVGVLSFSLFCRPAYCHYYFGDYYDGRYVEFGIRPWYYRGPHYGPDPLFGYYRWYHEDHLGEREWGHHLVGWNEYYRTHPAMRPPHTFAEQRALIASGAMRGRPDAHQLYMAHDVHAAEARAGAMRMERVSAAQHAELAASARQTAHFQQERAQFERSTAAGVRGPSQPTRATLTSMPSFKSNTLPGASASNVRMAGTVSANSAAAGRITSGAAAGRTTSGAAAGRTTSGAAATGAQGNRPAGATNPNYQPQQGRAVGPGGAPPTGRVGPPGAGSSSGRSSSGNGRGERDKDKEKGRN